MSNTNGHNAKQVLTLSMMARLNLVGIIKGQRPADRDKLYTLLEVEDKINIPADERSLYVLEVPGMQPQLKIKVIESAPALECEFEKAEMRAIAGLMKEVNPSTDDWRSWYKDLEAQIKDHGLLS